MFDKPEPFEHDGETWREQARGFKKASEAAAAIAGDTGTAATEAVWKGPMPSDRLARMEHQAQDGVRSAEVLAAMAEACDVIATEADDASSAIDDIRREWDDGNVIERLPMGGDADDVRDQFSERTAGARHQLAELAEMLQPVIDRGDPLDFLFSPIQGSPGAPYLGEQLDDDAATEYFDTGELINPEHVTEIETRINLVTSGLPLVTPSDWNAWAQENGYTQAEIAAALDQLDAEERESLNQWLEDNKGDIGNEETDPDRPAEGLTSFLWQNMRADQIEGFHNDVPALEPTLQDPADGWVDGTFDMTVNTDFTDGGAGVDDVRQGSIGDCATLASLAATVAADPTFIDRHIQENDNGTYTVTLYDEDGNPVPVTVSGYIPADDGNPIYNGRDLDGELNWVSLYEKAMAQYQGGHYTEIDGAYTADRITTTAGEGNTVTELPDDDLFAEMQEAFNDGKPIVMGGGGHAYAVVGFDENGNVLVQNPWGGDGSVVAMTPEQFDSGQFPAPADDWPDFSYVAVTD